MKRLRVLAAFAGVVLVGAHTAADVTQPSPLEIIQTAFNRMLNYPSVRSITLHVHRDGRRVTRRTFDVVYREIEGRGHTLLKFSAPDYLRDSVLLIIERDDGANDSWIFLPGDGRLRRVSSSQKADAFYATDFAFEDMEHHDWRRFALTRLADGEEQGQQCFRVEARPNNESAYSRIRVWVDQEDFALLRVDFYLGTDADPSKSLLINRADIESRDGVFVTRWMTMAQNGRDSSTQVELHRVELDPDIAEETFSAMRLERSGLNLFDLVTTREGRE